jgi:hypothetical protein
MSGWARWLQRQTDRARLRELDRELQRRERRVGANNLGPAPAPSSMIWYGLCTYWTDDWSTLSRTGHGIPCCPFCGAVGFQASAADWWAGAGRFE